MGCFTLDSLGPLVRVEGIINSQRYIDILNAHLIPFMEGLKGEIVDYKFQQDSALVHKSKLTMAFFEDSDINLMQWPGQSPELNPIEHLWDELEQHIRHRIHHQNLRKNSSRMEENPEHHILNLNFKHVKQL